MCHQHAGYRFSTLQHVPTDPQSRRRVVIAEDEAIIRLDLKEMLQEEGYSVVGEAADGETAVRLAEQHRPDLVVLDVKMPRMDGITAAEHITSAGIGPVILLTAFSQHDVLQRARLAGVMAFLVKPFGKSDLVPAIEIAKARYDEMAALERDVVDLRDRLETRKLVDRAKAVLQRRYGLSEPEAFRWVQRTSMDTRASMREVAESVLAQDDERARHPHDDA